MAGCIGSSGWAIGQPLPVDPDARFSTTTELMPDVLAPSTLDELHLPATPPTFDFGEDGLGALHDAAQFQAGLHGPDPILIPDSNRSSRIAPSRQPQTMRNAATSSPASANRIAGSSQAASATAAGTASPATTASAGTTVASSAMSRLRSPAFAMGAAVFVGFVVLLILAIYELRRIERWHSSLRTTMRCGHCGYPLPPRYVPNCNECGQTVIFLRPRTPWAWTVAYLKHRQSV